MPGAFFMFLFGGISIGTLVRIINCMAKEDHLDRILAWESGLGFQGSDGVTRDLSSYWLTRKI